MFREVMLVAGSACIGVALGAYLFRKYKSGRGAGEKASLEKLCDDECFVDELEPETLTGWFKDQNPDNRLENLVVVPTEENLKGYNISALISEIPQNCLLQALYDKEADAVRRVRLVSYGTIQEGLKAVLEEANGVLIIGE